MSWQGKVKAGPLVDRAGRPGAATMPGDDPLDRGQAHASAGKLAGRMEALEDSEQSVSKGHVKARAVVPHKKGRFSISRASEFNPRRGRFAGELPGVAQQVVQCHA